MFRKTMLSLPLGLLTLAACSDLGFDPTADSDVDARLVGVSSAVALAEPIDAVPDTVALTYNGALLSTYSSRRTTVRVTSSDTSVLVPTRDNFRVIARRAGKSMVTVRIGNLLRSSTVIVVPELAAPPEQELPPLDLAPPVPAPTPGGLLRSDYATLPTDSVRFSSPVRTGRLLRVGAGQSVQAAIDSAVYGDEIMLARGAVFTENVKLRRKAGSGWIIISGEGLTVPEGVRATPSALTGAARLQTASNALPAIEAEAGAAGYWMRGFEVTAASNVTMMYNLVMLDALVSDRAQLPSRLVLDRMWIHGRDDLGLFRCVMLGANRSQVSESWVDKCHISGFDSQAILIVNGEGPFLIRNNHLEGAGENFLIGGMAPSIAGLTPADIEIVGNHLYKPTSWRSKNWVVKNLFEIKFGRRIDFRGNLLENNWASGQTGTAILLRGSNQDLDPGVRTADVTVRHNVIANAFSGVLIDADGPVYMNRVAVLGNIFERMGEPTYGVGSIPRHLQFNGPVSQVDVSNNVFAFVPYSEPIGTAVQLVGSGATSVRIRDNVFDGGLYSVSGSGVRAGIPSLEQYAGTSYVFAANVISVEAGLSYPTGNTLLPQSQSAFGFVSVSTPDLHLLSSSAIATSHGWVNDIVTRAYSTRTLR